MTVAWGGHELPIYPSFYPHEIEIRTLAPEQAAEALREGEIQAYVGGGVRFAGAPPAEIRAIESLGSFIIVRINPDSPRAADEASACAAVKAVVRELAGARCDFILHPYPVTPFHGDYLHHADLAAAAKARFSDETAADAPPEESRQAGSLAQQHPGLVGARCATGTREVIEVDAAELMAAATLRRERLARAALAANRLVQRRASAWPMRIERPRRRGNASKPISGALKTGDFTGSAERINLERDLVTRAHRRLPENGRRLHGEAGIRQRRILGRDREHRI